MGDKKVPIPLQNDQLYRRMQDDSTMYRRQVVNDNITETPKTYKQLSMFGYLAHTGAAICAGFDVMNDIQNINSGEGVLFLCLSRLFREIQSLDQAVEKGNEELIEAGILKLPTSRCGILLCEPLVILHQLISTIFLAGIFSVASLVASLVDCWNEAHPSGSLGSIGVILIALNDLLEMVLDFIEDSQARDGDGSRKYCWCNYNQVHRHVLHLLTIGVATIVGMGGVILSWGDEGGLGADFAVTLLAVSKIFSCMGSLFDAFEGESRGIHQATLSARGLDEAELV